MPIAQSNRARTLAGTPQIPGDKSISHRAIILGALANGETHVSGLLEGEDVLSTCAAMRGLGAKVEKVDGQPGEWLVQGGGVQALSGPSKPLDMGNSGTAVRLLMGFTAALPFSCTFAGDASLSKRPMQRVITPLEQCGATFSATEGGRLPLTVTGMSPAHSIQYELPVASAQVKSAILLAGLNAVGETHVIEPRATRDHTELMLKHFGVNIFVEFMPGGGRSIKLAGGQPLKAKDVIVPSDISSAAFPLVAALLTEGSDITLPNIGVNPLRTGLLDALALMGANVQRENERIEAGEPVCDLRVRASRLKGAEIPASLAPAMIDEYPILAAAASCADGLTTMPGLSELRVKESDRLSAIAEGLELCGVKVEEGEDSLIVYGTGKPPRGTGIIAEKVKTHFDHRIAMAFLVLGMVTDEPVCIDDTTAIETSFPGFISLINGLGADIVIESKDGKV
ncbi:MAG: 3-phosphoshikimate 1-carboxyvinyltransferase [Rhodospirillales bacterium]